MGIEIRIGDAELRSDPSERHAWYEVPVIRHADAPGDGTNVWDASYSAMNRLHTITGLEALMGPKGGAYEDQGEWHCPLLDSHPGCIALTRYHLGRMQEIREAYKTLSEDERGPLIDEDGIDWGAVHLDWICYWTEWAIKSGPFPSIYNR